MNHNLGHKLAGMVTDGSSTIIGIKPITLLGITPRTARDQLERVHVLML